MPIERIVDCAREIVEADGSAGLTMRSLAARLHTSPTVLYRAVADRTELLDRVVDLTLGDVDVAFDPVGANWEDDARAAAMTMFEVLGRHRRLAPLLIDRVPTGPRAMLLRERLLSMLLAHGFSVHDASLVYATIARLVLGFAAQLTEAGDEDPREAERLGNLYRGFDVGDLPSTVAVADVLPFQQLNDEFRFALDLIISGLVTYRSRPA